jgi:probable rRNA maturation factor
VNSGIQFFAEALTFQLKEKVKHRKWLVEVIRAEKKKPWYVNFIFCPDNYLLDLNRIYLKRNTLTDVITFSAEEKEGIVSGDIFISIDRVAENAQKFKTSFEKELRRVMVHGVLHLMGYIDKSDKQKRIMRRQEDKYMLKYI